MSDMDDRNQHPSARVLRRGIRTMDMIVITTTFAVMLAMFLLIRHLNYLDILILNLIYSIDRFQSGRDLKEGTLNIFFGVIYIVGTFELSMHLALPCISCIVVSWIATCHSLGCPHVTWMYFLCLLMWVIKFVYKRTPDAIVVITVLKTASKFIVSREKSIEDFLIFFSAVSVHLAFFTIERYAFNYVRFSYLLAFAWMLLKSR